MIKAEDWKRALEERRYFKFDIPEDILFNYPETVKEILDDYLILEAKHMFDSLSIEYLVCSPNRKPLPKGDRAPFIKLEFNMGIETIVSPSMEDRIETIIKDWGFVEDEAP